MDSATLSRPVIKVSDLMRDPLALFSAGVVVLIVCVQFWALQQPALIEDKGIDLAILWPIIPWVAAIVALRRPSDRNLDRRLIPVWRMLGVTMIVVGVSSVVYLVLDKTAPENVLLTLLPDAIHLLAYPCFLAAIVLIPAEKIARSHWLGVGLDLVIMMTSALIAGWFFPDVS
ncbi:MAG: hypothetical protein R3F07_15595 [Opitutaceae bacterium]